MFGHDSLNHVNINSLLQNSESLVFKAGTPKPANWTDDYYEIRCTGNGAYRRAFLKSTGAGFGGNRGNQMMTDAQKISLVVNSLPNGSVYEIISCDGTEPTPLPLPENDEAIEDNTDTETGDPSDDPNAQDNGDGNGDSNGSNGDTDTVVDEDMDFGTMALIGLGIVGVGYFVLK